jgi:hypothetical protein
VRLLVLAAALLLAVAGALWLADRGHALPPVGEPTRTEGAAGKDPPVPAPAADGNEQFAPVPAADREPVATAPAPPSVDVAALIAAGVPAEAAADVATAFADLRRVAASGVAANAVAADAVMQHRIALVLALAPELPARLADRSIRVQATSQKSAGAAVATSSTMIANGRNGPELTMIVHGRTHVVRFRVPRSVGPDDRWRALLDGK